MAEQLADVRYLSGDDTGAKVLDTSEPQKPDVLCSEIDGQLGWAHVVMGVCGRPMQSPFATPPGQGLSSALVNVLWGTLNLLVGYLLIYRVGSFDLRRWRHAAVSGAGFLWMAVMLARTFSKFYGG